MIIQLDINCPLKTKLEVAEIMRSHCVGSHWVPGKNIIVAEISKDTMEDMQKRLKGITGVRNIINTMGPHKLVSRDYQRENTVIKIKDVVIGGKEVILMAGPCALESEDQFLRAAHTVKKCGGKILRAGVFKPRTSPYSFQGMGVQGLEIIEKVKEEMGLLVVSEIIDSETLSMASPYFDILQIGARNMQNYPLLKEAGRSGKPILLKRGMSATIKEWLLAAEYILSMGNSNVILCERGIRTYETATRNTLDLSAIPVLKELTHLPIIVDPSHAAGKSNLVSPLAWAAVAAGADGLLVEMHPEPEKALCDGEQCLNPETFKIMTSQLRQIVAALGRELHSYPESTPAIYVKSL
jgi:3-deoxy-7-phosphoheptulonate synthase